MSKELKSKLLEETERDIYQIETRMKNRVIQFEFEQKQDQEKLDFLNLQHQSIKEIK